MMGNKNQLVLDTERFTVKIILQYDSIEDNFDVNSSLVCLNEQQEVCSIINYSQSNFAIQYIKTDDMAEEFFLDLSKFGEISDVYFVVSILNGLKRAQNLLMIRQIAFIIPECNFEFELSNLEELKEETAIVVGRLYQSMGKWKIQIMPEAYTANSAYQIFF